MAGEKNEREVVRVENAQYTDGAGGGHTLGAGAVRVATRNTGRHARLGMAHCWSGAR